jgi:hypothetical protein
MLIEQLDNKHEGFPYPTKLWGNNSPSGQNNNTPFRQQFQTNLNSNGISGSNGYPQNLRKIALINGTTNGTTTNNAGNKFLELAAFTNIKWGQIFGTPIITGKIKVATINDSFLQNTGGNGQTFSGKVTIKRVGGLEVQNGSVKRTNSNPRGCMDIVQGGTFNTQGIIKDEFTIALNDAVDSQEWRTYLPNHAFIPSVSSLAFKDPNFNWSSALNRNLVCDPNNKEIYFDTYFAPSKNEEHVFISAENANWLIKELQGIPQVPYFPIPKNAFFGPDFVCENQNAIFTFGDICKIPSAVVWSTSSNLQIVSSTSYSITVSPISNGHGTITATFQNGQTFTKTIWVGKPRFINLEPIGNQNGYNPYEPNLSYSEGGGCNQIKLTAVFGSPDILEYQWEKITAHLNWSVYPTSNVINIMPQCNENFTFKVRARNLCGWSDWVELDYFLNRCTMDCSTPITSIVGENFILSPVPVTNGLLQVGLTNNAPWFIIGGDSGGSSNPSLDPGTGVPYVPASVVVNVSIYNQIGLLVMNLPNRTIPTSIDLNSLPVGTYIINFEYQGQIESHTFVKN